MLVIKIYDYGLWREPGSESCVAFSSVDFRKDLGAGLGNSNPKMCYCLELGLLVEGLVTGKTSVGPFILKSCLLKGSDVCPSFAY